jgi:hypothetical protein
MDQERKPNIGEVSVANPYGGQAFPAGSTVSSDPMVQPRSLEWMGPHTFKARHGTQPGVDPDVGMWWGPRHDQRTSHRRTATDSHTGLAYAYDLTWDECAVLAIDVPAAALETVLDRARTDLHMSAEAFAGLLADHLAAPTPHLESTTQLAAGVEL